jgi:acyl-CoA hydrolase
MKAQIPHKKRGKRKFRFSHDGGFDIKKSVSQGRADMISYKLVLPQHMNQFGFLFGGNLLNWVDETAWMAVSLDYPGYRLVTIGMDRVEFKKSVNNGAILRFEVTRIRVGRTSVTYSVDVFRHEFSSRTDCNDVIFHTDITFVRVDENGVKQPLAGDATQG